MKINKAWHRKNKMPKNPTIDARIKWHVAHAKNCGCRKIAGKLLEEITKRGIKLQMKKSEYFVSMKILI